MVPLLSLGIPGDAVTAILIGAFMIHGVSPGPLMFTTQRHLVYAIFTALIVSNFAMLIMEFAFLRLFIQFLKLPKKILLPLILAVCVIGAVGANNRTFDVYIILFFGLVGYALKKFNYPVAPMVMGFVLGPLLEANLRRALIFSKGSLEPFFTRPVSCAMLAVTFLSILWPAYRALRKQKRRKAEQS